MLYILQAEPLAAYIRQNPCIKGNELPHRSDHTGRGAKLNMFADDTQVINKTEKSIEESFRILNIYEKASDIHIKFSLFSTHHVDKYLLYI